MEQLENPLRAQPQTVNLLIRIAERRMLLAVQRKESKFDSARLIGIQGINWIEQYKQAEVYGAWEMNSSSAVIAMESKEARGNAFDHLADDKEFWRQASRWHRVHARLSRPWIELSYLQVAAATARDSKIFLEQEPCHPIISPATVPGFVILEPVWYKPGGFIQHPSLSWWNPIGKVIYAIGAHLGREVVRGFRFDLESELTDKVIKLHAARQADGHWPAAIPGIETSICKNEKWNYAVAPDGNASLNFSGKPEWGTMKGAQVPLRWMEAAPVVGAGSPRPPH